MANIMRWRYDETNPVTLSVDAATDIEVGDLIWLDRHHAKPASAIAVHRDPLPGHVVDSQLMFRDKFVGVAMTRSRVGTMQTIRVATSGLFEFDAVKARFEIGNCIAVAYVGGLLEDQRVVGVDGDAQECIGRVAKRAPIGDPVLVEIYSTVISVN